MGPPHYKGFLFKNLNFFDKVHLCDMKIVIDANNLMVAAFSRICKNKKAPTYRGDIYGGDLVQYAETLRLFFDKLAKCNVEPILVCGGSGLASKHSLDIDFQVNEAMRKAMFRFEECKRIGHQYPGEQMAMITVLNIVFGLVLDELDLKRIRAPHGVESHVATLANEYGCPVISNNSDFNLMPITAGVILADDLLKIPLTYSSTLEKPVYRSAVTCKCFKISKMLQAFPGLTQDQVYLFGALQKQRVYSSNPFEHLTEFLRVPHEGRHKWSTYDHQRIANTLDYISRTGSVDGCLHDLRASEDERAALMLLAHNFHINEVLDLETQLELVYPPSDYESLTSSKPAQFLTHLLTAGDLPAGALDIIFQKPFFEKAVIDDSYLPSAGHVRLRPLSVLIALLRPHWQVGMATPPPPSPARDSPFGHDSPSSSQRGSQAGSQRGSQSGSQAGSQTGSQSGGGSGGSSATTSTHSTPSYASISKKVWRFFVYDRPVKGVGIPGLVSSHLTAPRELEGFGSLREMHIGETIQLDPDRARLLLLSVFRCDEQLYAKLESLTDTLFGPRSKHEAQTCFMLMRYCAIESDYKPRRELVEAFLITMLFYFDESIDDQNKLQARIAARCLINKLEDLKIMTRQAETRYRSIMHSISQLSAAYWSYVAVNSVLGHPLTRPQLHYHYNCVMTYELTQWLTERALSLQSAFDDAGVPASFKDTINQLLDVVLCYSPSANPITNPFM